MTERSWLRILPPSNLFHEILPTQKSFGIGARRKDNYKRGERIILAVLPGGDGRLSNDCLGQIKWS